MSTSGGTYTLETICDTVIIPADNTYIVIILIGIFTLLVFLLSKVPQSTVKIGGYKN
jgi:hypothetical protein